MEYNTERRELLLKEYGRSVQEMIAYICTIEDKQQRTAYAYLLVNLMKQLNPAVRDSMDTPQRVWDHLHYMSDFKLDIDGPFPAPEPGKLFAKPEPIAYPKGDVMFKNLGRNLERMLLKAVDIEEEEERIAALVMVGRTMKSFYYAWYKEVIEDEQVLEYIRNMSNRKADLQAVWEEHGPGLFDSRSVPNKERHHQILMKANAHHNGNQLRNDRDRKKPFNDGRDSRRQSQSPKNESGFKRSSNNNKRR